VEEAAHLVPEPQRVGERLLLRHERRRAPPQLVARQVRRARLGGLECEALDLRIETNQSISGALFDC